VVIFSRLAGWTVHDLGNDVQPAEFVNRALETGSRIIGVSAMIFNTAMNIRRVREEIDNRGLTGKIQLCVGGAVFRLRPGLMNETGADGTAGNAMKAPDLFSEMLKRILQ
jgi:methanogenic corrinoid protein MtbC1